MILLADSIWSFSLPWQSSFSYIELTAWQMVLSLLVIIAVIALPLIIFSIVRYKLRGEKFVFTTRDVAYAAICVALSYALSWIGIRLPFGGTITFASILPVAVYCYFFGFRKAAIVCAVYMLLQLTQTPYIINVWSMLLDYLIPYFALSLVGIFSYNSGSKAQGQKRSLARHWGFFAGMLIYIIIRYVSHVLCGVLFWGDPDGNMGFAALGYSLSYNSFCLIDMAIAAAAAVLLLSSKNFEHTISRAVQRSRASVKRPDGSVSTEVDGLGDTYAPAKDDKRA